MAEQIPGREVESMLDVHGLPHSYAPAVAQFVDRTGWSVERAVSALSAVMPYKPLDLGGLETSRTHPGVRKEQVEEIAAGLRKLGGDSTDG